MVAGTDAAVTRCALGRGALLVVRAATARRPAGLAAAGLRRGVAATRGLRVAAVTARRVAVAPTVRRVAGRRAAVLCARAAVRRRGAAVGDAARLVVVRAAARRAGVRRVVLRTVPSLLVMARSSLRSMSASRRSRALSWVARLLFKAAGDMRLSGVLLVVARRAVVRLGAALLVVVRRAAGRAVERLGVRVVRLAAVLLVVRGMICLLCDLAAFMSPHDGQER